MDILQNETVSEKFNTIIIGGGPAGMMAAIKASYGGNSVCILEKNDRLGKKLRITGKGRCNITNDCEFEELMSNIPENSRFLFSCFKKFSNRDIIAFFNEAGLPTVTERGNRVFPVSQQAVDVVKVLKKELDKAGVSVFYKSEVSEIIVDEAESPEGKIMAVRGTVLSDGRKIYGKHIVVATGGVSYPLTGSTGDGYRFAEKTGHKIIETRPSLVRVISSDKDIRELRGLSLKNVSVVFTSDKNGKKLYEDFGEMLFTGDGISGPIVLSASRHLLSQDYRDVTAHIDFKPALSEEKLEERVKRDFESYSRKQLKNSLGDLLPKALIAPVIIRSGIDENKFVNQITKAERKKLIEVLKNFTVKIVKSGPMDEAIVTSGGVCINEINPKTMESKRCRGMYFAGEVIDVDGYTGGFNLTIAFSTGYAAGDAIAAENRKNETV